MEATLRHTKPLMEGGMVYKFFADLFLEINFSGIYFL